MGEGTDLTRLAELWVGVLCRDRVTGFYGTGTAAAVYMDSSPKVLIEAPSPTGDPKSRWVDVGRVEACDEPPPGVYA